MKYCPNCQANVEGLIHQCDCCGASLDIRSHFFFCGIYDVPACLGLSSLAFKMVEELEIARPTQYSKFLEKILFKIYCLPEAVLTNENIRNRVYYSSKAKQATITILIDYNDYIYSDNLDKANLVANAIYQGLYMLQIRMSKNQHNINEIITHANLVLSRYRTPDSSTS